MGRLGTRSASEKVLVSEKGESFEKATTRKSPIGTSVSAEFSVAVYSFQSLFGQSSEILTRVGNQSGLFTIGLCKVMDTRSDF
jgi:hypothetical protein